MTVEPPDWDGWRAAYDTLSFEDQQAFYRKCAQMYPDQAHFDLDAAIEFFERYEPRIVSELGGWDGQLAEQILRRFDVEMWLNTDIVAVPPAARSPHYTFVLLPNPRWNFPIGGDAFIATHVIEHIKARELEMLAGSLRVKACLIEAPLEDGPTDWTGYEGTHILEIGWDGVDAIFADHGYRRVREGQTRFYERV